MSALEIAGVLTGILAVWLTTREKVWCWPIGIVSVLLFVAVFYRARLYAAMGLQVVYVGLALYGWYAWVKGAQGAALRVSRTPRRTLVAAAAVGAAATIGSGSGWGSRPTNRCRSP